MYEYTENKSRALELARQCLAAEGESLEPLLVYVFEDGNEEAHDDELQEKLESEFYQLWLATTEELNQTFGRGATHELSWDGGIDWIPLNGIGGASSWDTDQGRLWLAYAHEDRETPFLLMIGKACP